MTNKTMGGPLPVRRPIDAAANGERLMAAVTSPQGLLEPDRQGWDPFEVWRTRVKEARERTNHPAPVDTRKA
jgi:hypothetical protein